MNKRNRSNSFTIDHSKSGNCVIFSVAVFLIMFICDFVALFLAALERLCSLNSSPGPRRKSPKPTESPPPMSLFSNYQDLLASPSFFSALEMNDFGKSTTTNASAPSTPVDIKSVSQVRQLSSKKVIYSYTFGGSEETGTTKKQADRATDRSPSKNCRQNFQSKQAHFKLESSSPFYQPKRKY